MGRVLSAVVLVPGVLEDAAVAAAAAVLVPGDGFVNFAS
jgi:hypothetical protein